MEMTISISASVFFSHFFFPSPTLLFKWRGVSPLILFNPCVPFVSLILLPLGHFDPQTSLEHITTVMPSPLVFFFLFSCFSSREKKKKLEELLNVFCTFSTSTSSPAACCLAFFVYLTSSSLLNLLYRGSPMTFLLLTSWYFLLSLLNCFCHYQECLAFSRILYSVLFFSLFILVKFSYISVVSVINYC